MIPSIGPATLRLLAALLAWYYRRAERAAVRDLAEDLRHVRELRAVAHAWETIAHEPTIAVFNRAMVVLREALADLDAHDHRTRACGAATDTSGPRASYTVPPEETWEGEGRAHHGGAMNEPGTDPL
jgi:hypothetical protein